ncbi:hypothetical protein ACJMK2_006230 [Sinanodonta woodiana]|uniref:C-type lectin domain-containing protein n=1 Tax=Sinanodonta woodiana TaxID=1069815 RepID=A0ABD3VU53_SINWO
MANTVKVLITCLCAVITVSKAQRDCPDGWIQHTDNCYLFSHDVETWPGAWSICRAVGGFLAEIHDAKENAYIYNQIQTLGIDHWWLGGADIEVEGDWMWVNSRTMFDETYTNWRTGEPNSLLKNENCLEMEISGLWNDNSCTIPMHYICKKGPQVNGQTIIG